MDQLKIDSFLDDSYSITKVEYPNGKIAYWQNKMKNEKVIVTSIYFLR